MSTCGTPKIPDEPGNKREFDVGYSKPPKEHQFKPGNTIGAAGRPKGRSLFQAICQILEEDDSEESARAFVAAMKKGSFQHAKEVIDRQEGKVPEKSETTHKFSPAEQERAVLRRILEDPETRDLAMRLSEKLDDGSSGVSGSGAAGQAG